MADVTVHIARNLAQAEQLGQTERVKALKARLAELEAPAEEVDPVDEFHTGGGWYQIGDEKVQGKAAARKAFEALEGDE